MASSLTVSGFVIPRLGADNYSTWSQKVSMLLRREGLWICVDNPPEDMEEEMDEKALATIVLTLEDRELIHVRGITTAKACWDALKAIHVRDSVGSQIHLTRKLFRARLQPGGDLLEHLENVKRMLMDLREKEVVFTEPQEVFILLSSLDSSFDIFVSNLEILPRAELTMSSVTSRLLEEAQRRKDNALLRKSNSTSSRPTEEGQSEELEEGERAFTAKRCFGCGSTKHFVRQCKARKGKTFQPKRNYKYEAHLTMAGTPIRDSSSCWLLDSGSSAHISHVRSMFTEMKWVNNCHVTLADGIRADIKGEGLVYLPALKQKLKMLYVPSLKHNLLSISSLTKQGYVITFSGENCSIKSTTGEILSVKKEQNLYKLIDEQLPVIANIYENKEPHNNCIHVWHKRLGHANYKAVRKTLESALPVKVNQCGKYVHCEPCIEGKSKHAPIGKSSNINVPKILHLVSMDLIGPMKHESFGGAKYILSIQDQYSRFGFCYLLKDKTQTANEFESWLKFVERKTGEKVKTVQTDNGMEFKCAQFQNILRKHGIQHRCSAPYTPTQNSFIERRGQTLQNMAQTILVDSGLSPRYWGEAALYSCFSMNVIFHSSLNCTPYEMWTGRKPNLSYLHSFGAPSWVCKPLSMIRKGESKIRKMYFLGYQSNRKAMRFGTADGKVIVSSSAKIDDAFGLEQQPAQLTIPNAIQPNRKEKEKQLASKQTPKKESLSELTPEVQGSSDQEEEVKPGGYETPKVIPRRTTRQVKPPERYSPTVCCVINSEPNSYEEILKLPQSERQCWLNAIKKELDSLQQLEVYEKVKLPEREKVLGCRWIFKKKVDATGEVRYRARLVAKGYLQTADDFDQNFAPVLRAETLRFVLTYAAKHKYVIRHVDFETAYLNSSLDHVIHMEIPPGVEGSKNYCWKLKKSLYGLKQSAYQWNTHLTDTLNSQGFKQGIADPCLFTKDGNIILIFVDDVLIATPTEKENLNIIEMIRKKYKIRDLGKVQNYLGVEIVEVENGYKISQKQKIVQLVKQYNMQNCKGVNTPMIVGFEKDTNVSIPCNKEIYRSLIGSLLYISQWTRPDIAMAVNYLAKFSQEPTQKHWHAAKWVIRYLKETQDKALYITPDNELLLSAYADANFGNDPRTRKSTTGLAIYLGRTLIHWRSIRQHFIALSTSEAEVCALSTLCTELIWFKQLAKDLNMDCEYAIQVFEDNQAAIAMASSPGTKARTKHTDIRYHNVKQAVNEGKIKLQYCKSDMNASDGLTKVLGPNKHEKSCKLLGIQ